MSALTKLKPQTLEIVPDTGAKRISAFENYLHLEAMARYQIRGRDIGAFLLEKNGSLRVTFGFECRGVHATLPESQTQPTLKAIEDGLKDLPEGETLTFRARTFADDALRQEQLRALQENCEDNPILQLILVGERKRVWELKEDGKYNPKTLQIFATYTVPIDIESKQQDALGKAILKTKRSWEWITGKQHQSRRIRLEALLRRAFSDGFLNWEQLLSGKMGLPISPMNASQLWATAWDDFNHSEPIPIPHLLTINDTDISEDSSDDFHITTKLMRDDGSVPFVERGWVHHKHKYVSVMTLSEKPGGWNSAGDQLRYLWEVLSHARVRDTEVIAQFSRANEALAKTALQRLTKQSVTNTDLAARKSNIDVGSQIKAQESAEGQAKMIKGAIPIRTALVFLIHRDRYDEMVRDSRYFCGLFRRPAEVLREREYAWKIWMQCSPLVFSNLLAKPFDRRLAFFTDEAPGLAPFSTIVSKDSDGLELIADEGASPVFLDLFSKHENLMVFGTTRSGKSVLAGGILTQALARSLPVVALDYPKPDGSSTFSDYTQLVGGAYFDIGNEAVASNPFELPNLNNIEDKAIRQERFKDYQDFLISLLYAMVVGDAPVSALQGDTVRNVLGFALNEFYADPDVRARYHEAKTEGFGTSAWEQTPTLVDFFNFCQPGFLDLDRIGIGGEADPRNALDLIRTRLRYWLETSRVGRALSRPSTFRSDNPLLVFALRNLSNDTEAAILSLVAYSAALRQALAHPASIFFIDESPILFEYDAIAQLIGRLCANGAKAGIRVILSAQGPKTIYNSAAGDKIFDNMKTRLVGRLEAAAVDTFIEIFKYPKDIIRVNATEAFFPKKEGLYSQWLLDKDGRYSRCRYYPGMVQLAATANNPDEQKMRDRYMARHESPLQGIAAFAKDYVRDLSS